MKKDFKQIVEVVIGFDLDTEEIIHIKSDFMSEDYSQEKGIEYTAKLIQMGLEKWIKDKIGLFCPNCEIKLEDDWEFCPNCGWNSNE